MNYSTENLFAADGATERVGKPVRVCHVSLTLATGGLERLLADFARFHDASRFEMEYVAMRDVGRFGDEIREGGLPVFALQASGRLSQIVELSQHFRERAIDVVHTHNLYPHLYATIAARLAGVPVVVNTRHGQRIGHGWKSRLLYRLASYQADRMVAVSQDAARLCTEEDGVSPEKVTCIWNGIDVESFPFVGPARAPVAIAVARLSAEKDFPTLLRAVQHAVVKVPDLKLRIVGDGPERTRIEQLRSELSLDDNVELLGERTDVPELLAGGAFFVSSSLSEGISLTLLEAMSVGLPVLATAVGGNIEVVDQGNTGRLVPAGNPNALAEAIVAVCRQPEKWHPMGIAARQRVQHHFEIRRMVAEYEDLYEQLIQESARTRRKTLPVRAGAETVNR
jgi:glycosyltransferase involved in cell wall biosynthesis